MVTTKSELMPEGWAESLQVVHDGEPVANPTLVIVRIVHTGDGAIETGDFETSLTLRLEGAESIASVNRTGQRPADFAPELVIDGNTVRVEQTLINPEDMLELQILSVGKPEKVELGGGSRA